MTLLFDPIANEDDRAYLAETLAQFEKDTRYLDGHRTEWLESYPDCWVIVYREELIGHSESLTELLKVADNKGIPREQVAREYLSSQPRAMILGTVKCR